MPDRPNVKFKRFVGDETGERVIHAPGDRSLVLCKPNLVGAAIFRTFENVSCLDCLVKESE